MPPVIVSNVMLDLVEIFAAATSWQIDEVEQRTLRPLADGSVREVITAAEPGYPVVPRHRTFTFDYGDLESERDRIRLILSAPGRHTLILWLAEHLAWVGDGVRREFLLPNGWQQASDLTAAPTTSSIDTRTTLRHASPTGAPIPATTVDAATYAAGDPPSGEAWALERSSQIKVGDVPGAGAYLYGTVYPVYSVLRVPGAERKHDGPLADPYVLRLQE
ncbi:MAG: hypothetical protein AAGN66_17835 [Acidobacteriota bacterium]